MNIFKGQNLLEFSDRFKTDLDCKEYLSELKDKTTYKCLKCNDAGYQRKADFSLQCNVCNHKKSSTSNILFYKVKFDVRKAFFACFEMSTTTKSLSASYMSVHYGITEKTARLFMLKVRKTLIKTDKWRGYNPISKAYNIKQIESNSGLNFKALHTIIPEIKSWIITTYPWVSDHNLNRSFNEFLFRINRFQSKDTIFNNLITKMVNKDKIYQTKLITNY